MTKRWSILLAAALAANIVCAQEMPTASEADVDASLKRMRERHVAERIERHRLKGKENNLFFTISSGMSYDEPLAIFKLEYSRQIKGNFYWGCNLSANFGLGTLFYDFYDDRSDCLGYVYAPSIYKFDGMLFYRFPVIRSRLFFRVGTGFGAGYHHIKGSDRDGLRKDYVYPYFNFEAAWILRITKGFEMKFSPLIIVLPSEFAFSPVKRSEFADPFWVMNAGVALTLGCRF